MSCRILRGEIDLNQFEVRRIVRLLEHIKAGNARLLDAFLRIFQRNDFKFFIDSGFTRMCT